MTVGRPRLGWAPFVLIGAALVIVAAVLLLSGPRETSADSAVRQTEQREPEADLSDDRAMESATASLFSRGFPADSPAAQGGTDSSSALPLEWEAPFFQIMMEPGQTMGQRNARLIEFAIRDAAAVPRVQQECLRHLAFGLPDNEAGIFVRVATAASIPGELRREFLRQVLAIRPAELTVPLCEALSGSGDAAVASLAADYLSRAEARGLAQPPGPLAP